MNVYSTNSRLEICKKCPIFTTDGRCNPQLWLNPDTNQVSTFKKTGYIRGCNCLIAVKARNPNNHCVAGKW